MSREIILNIETRAERRRANQGTRAGLHGMSEGYDTNTLNVATMTKKSWDNVTQKKNWSFWRKAAMLSAGHSAEINASESRMPSDMR